MDLITTVTYLEMVSYPKHLILTKPEKLNAEIKLMVEPTVDFYRYLYDTVGEKWTWIERRLLDDNNLQKLIRSSNVEIYILYVDDNVAGFGEIGWDTASNGSEIKYFGLMPEYIGKRLGPYFLNNIINIAWGRNPVRLRVNTCDLDHPSALRVYQKSGFNVLEEIVEKLPDPTTVGLPHPPSHQERQRRLNNR
jgi:GNAT superfamily N-acetyltransferase|tara:strand:- start:3591 stop:4169 length:579 start_codon:yes stop_codon:yes gene_type:complete